MEQGLNSLGVFDATMKLDLDPQVTKQIAKVSNARCLTSGKELLLMRPLLGYFAQRSLDAGNRQV